MLMLVRCFYDTCALSQLLLLELARAVLHNDQKASARVGTVPEDGHLQRLLQPATGAAARMAICILVCISEFGVCVCGCARMMICIRVCAPIAIYAYVECAAAHGDTHSRMRARCDLCISEYAARLQLIANDCYKVRCAFRYAFAYAGGEEWARGAEASLLACLRRSSHVAM